MLVIGVLAVLGCGAAWLWIMQRHLVYFPSRDVPLLADAMLPTAEAVTLKTADGLALGGWFVTALGPPPHVTILVFNGNAGNRFHRAPLAAALSRHGFHVLLFDYRGFGGNPGHPSEAGLTADARAAYALLASRRDVDLSHLVYFGESLGTGVAVRFALERPPSALILRSPFTSLVDIGRYHYPFLPVRLLLRDRFPTIDRIRLIDAPLLVIAGGQDRIVPPESSRRVYEAAVGRKTLLLLPNADHNDDELFAGDEMIAAVVQFIPRGN